MLLISHRHAGHHGSSEAAIATKYQRPPASRVPHHNKLNVAVFLANTRKVALPRSLYQRLNFSTATYL